MADTEIELIKQSMDNLDKSLTELKEDNKSAHLEMMTAFKEAINQKAGKWVETVVLWAAATFVVTSLSVTGYLLTITFFK